MCTCYNTVFITRKKKFFFLFSEYFPNRIIKDLNLCLCNKYKEKSWSLHQWNFSLPDCIYIYIQVPFLLFQQVMQDSEFIEDPDIIWLSVYIYYTSPPWTRYNTRSIFKQSTAGLNSEFSFFKTGCLMTKQPHLFCYLPIYAAHSWRERGGIHAFFQDCSI